MVTPAVRTASLIRPSLLRSFATAQPPQKPNQKNQNTLLLIAAGTAAAAGLYWYTTHPDDVKRVKEEAKKEETEVTTKARELGESTRARVQDTLSQGREILVDAKATGKEKLGLARSATRDAEVRARDEIQADLDNVKGSLEKTYSEGREKATEAKAGWLNWWRPVKVKADDTKRNAAAKAAAAAEDVKKHS